MPTELEAKEAAKPSTEISDGAKPNSLIHEIQNSANQAIHSNDLSKPGESTPSLPKITIENFAKVDDGIYRGATPTPSQLVELQKLGIRTIVDLRIPDKHDFQESRISRQLGINFIGEPLLYNRPRTEQMAEVMSIINNPANQPVYVHCREGQDRTGTVIGTERRIVDGWSYEDTYKEMLKFGFHPIYKELAKFVKDSPEKNLPYTKKQN